MADTLGLLLTLIWTAGFLPGFLDGRSISVLLAKPAPRWLLLAGKYVGVLAFVLFHATLFVGGTWLAIGCERAFGMPTYLYAIPLLLLHFAVFFSVSLLLAVLTRSTVVCVFGSISVLVHRVGNELRAACPGGRSRTLMPDGQFFDVAQLAGRFRLLDSAEAGRFRNAAVQCARCQELFRLGVRHDFARRPRLFALALRAHFAGLHRLHAFRRGPPICRRWIIERVYL